MLLLLTLSSGHASDASQSCFTLIFPHSITNKIIWLFLALFLALTPYISFTSLLLSNVLSPPSKHKVDINREFCPEKSSDCWMVDDQNLSLLHPCLISSPSPHQVWGGLDLQDFIIVYTPLHSASPSPYSSTCSASSDHKVTPGSSLYASSPTFRMRGQLLCRMTLSCGLLRVGNPASISMFLPSEAIPQKTELESLQLHF